MFYYFQLRLDFQTTTTEKQEERKTKMRGKVGWDRGKCCTALIQLEVENL